MECPVPDTLGHWPRPHSSFLPFLDHTSALMLSWCLFVLALLNQSWWLIINHSGCTWYDSPGRTCWRGHPSCPPALLPQPPPPTRPSPREHPPSRISPSSSPPIAARLIHFSSQCVRSQPTRQKHPCLPIRYSCSGPRNSLKPPYLKPNYHHPPTKEGGYVMLADTSSICATKNRWVMGTCVRSIASPPKSACAHTRSNSCPHLLYNKTPRTLSASRHPTCQVMAPCSTVALPKLGAAYNAHQAHPAHPEQTPISPPFNNELMSPWPHLPGR